MNELIVTLVPVVLGVVLSPLAIMALVAVLLSERGRTNGIAYLIGWIVGLAGLLLLFQWIFGLSQLHELGEPPLWASLLRLLLGTVLALAAVWVYQKGKKHVMLIAAATTPKDVAAAAPQLPGWLQTVETFRPARTFVLGTGLFVLNPVDASCAIIAALDISLADIDAGSAAWVTLAFIVIGTLPIAIPVLYVVVKGPAAQPLLDRIRRWIAGHTHVLNAGLLLVIGALQLQKGIAALI